MSILYFIVSTLAGLIPGHLSITIKAYFISLRFCNYVIAILGTGTKHNVIS